MPYQPWSAPPKSRPPMSHRKSDLGIPCPRKICQSSARNSSGSAQAPRSQHFLHGAQRRRYAPARRVLQVVDVLAQLFMSRASRSAVRICEQSNGAIDVEPRAQALGEALGGIDGNVVQAMQLVDDHQFDQLVDAERVARGAVFGRSVGLVDRVAAEQDIHHRRFAETVVLRVPSDALALERASKAGARNAIEGEIEYQQMMLQQDFRERPEMALGIGGADPEIGLGLDAKHVGQEIAGTEQDVLLEAF